jgi:adenylate cyclase
VRILKYGGLIIFALLLHFYLYHFNIIRHLDYRLHDILNQFIPDKKADEHHVVIVDIDNESLREFSQWSGIVNAQLINQLSLYNPASIGVNIIFSEKDRTSPLNIQQFYKDFYNFEIEMPTLPSVIKDNDFLLENSIETSQSILSIYLSKENDLFQDCNVLRRNHYDFSNIKTSLSAQSVLCNYHDLQSKVKNFGFSNLQIDSDGLLRRTPLFISYQNKLIPSFSLATLLSIDSIQEEEEKNKFSILGHNIRLDKESYALLNFHTALAPKISAIDVLKKKVGKEIFQGKVVLIGSSAMKVNYRYLLPHNKIMSNTMIHATLIENILNDSLYVQPDRYKNINLSLSFFFSFLMVWLLFKRWYVLIMLIFSIIMIVSSAWVVLAYLSNIYVSIGYLWIPFLDFFFIMSISFILLYVKEKEKSHQALLKSHVATIDSISLIASMHDDETEAHINRTKNYVKLLAEYFYDKKMYREILTPEYINSIYEAAPLHDIGKIGIPDSILKKPGKLTEEEFEIMKTHSTLGRNVIQNTMNAYDKNDFLKVAYNIAYYHHEKWDGTGYPIGLKGNEIPLEAQFMTLADVYDALISKRRYKEAFTFETAENIILKGRGTVYSPEIIEAFLELKKEFRKIALRWKD